MLSLGVSPRSSPCTKVPVGFQIFYQSITALSLNTALNPTICGQSQISLPEHYCCFILFSNGERLLNKLYIFTRTWLGLKEWPRVKSGIKWSQCTCWVAMVSIFWRKKSLWFWKTHNIYREENFKNGFIPRFDACLIKLIAIGYS